MRCSFLSQACGYALSICTFFILSAGAFGQKTFYVNGKTGKDIKGNGLSAAKPWKTISFALSKITPPTQAQQSHTLKVAGGQTYSTATNGESFPLRPIYNVSIEAPLYTKIVVGKGQDAFVFDKKTVFNRNQVTIKGFEVLGGRVGAVIGGNQNIPHRPRFSNCIFRFQTDAGIRIMTQGTNIDDPKFFQVCIFNARRGIVGTATRASAVLRPDIDECLFQNIKEQAVLLEDRSGPGSDVGGLVRNSIFCHNGQGVVLFSGPNVKASRLDIISNFFTGHIGENILVMVNHPADPRVKVEGCHFLGGSYGFRLTGRFNAGSYNFDLENNFAFRTTKEGFSYEVGGSAGRVSVKSRRNLALRCGGNGFRYQPASKTLAFTLDSVGDRANRCEKAGLALLGMGAKGSKLELSQLMSTNNKGQGISYSAAIPGTLQFATLASNGASGLKVSPLPTLPSVDHCVLGGNKGKQLDAPGSIKVSYTCTQGQNFAGKGNINKDPKLDGTTFKLLPNSPCIDAGRQIVKGTDYEGDPRTLKGKQSTLPDLGADEFSPTGSGRPYGPRGIGWKAVHPVLSSPTPNNFVLGGTSTIQLSGAKELGGTPSVASALWLGASEFPFGADLTGFGARGSSNLLLNPLFAGIFPVDKNGRTQIRFKIPMMSSLLGLSFFIQMAAIHPGVNPGSYVTSNGLRITLGPDAGR